MVLLRWIERRKYRAVASFELSIMHFCCTMERIIRQEMSLFNLQSSHFMTAICERLERETLHFMLDHPLEEGSNLKVPQMSLQ